jgi:hypothetical protein
VRVIDQTHRGGKSVPGVQEPSKRERPKILMRRGARQGYCAATEVIGC